MAAGESDARSFSARSPPVPGFTLTVVTQVGVFPLGHHQR